MSIPKLLPLVTIPALYLAACHPHHPHPHSPQAHVRTPGMEVEINHGIHNGHCPPGQHMKGRC